MNGRMGECLLLRKAMPTDVEAMGNLYREAKALLKSKGVDQWQQGGPDESSALGDIQSGTAYVLELDQEVVGCACLALGREPTYETIYQGSWQEDPPAYGFLHRIAISGKCKGKGAAALFFQTLAQLAKEAGLTLLRCDTHQDNLAMQRVLDKSGFTLRGQIVLEDGTMRLAYEKNIS